SGRQTKLIQGVRYSARHWATALRRLAGILNDGYIGDRTTAIKARFQVLIDPLGCGTFALAQAIGLERFNVWVCVGRAHCDYRESVKIGGNQPSYRVSMKVSRIACLEKRLSRLSSLAAARSLRQGDLFVFLQEGTETSAQAQRRSQVPALSRRT